MVETFPSAKFVVIMEYGEDSARRISCMLDRLRIRHQIIRPLESTGGREGPSRFPVRPQMEPTHVILSGGPKHVYERDSYKMPTWIYHTSAPVLGICYGMQLIAYTFGGHVQRMPQKEKGPIEVIEIIQGEQIVRDRWMNRNDIIRTVPPFFQVTGVTFEHHIAAFTDNAKWWGVQYHPEAKDFQDYGLFSRFLSLPPALRS